MNYQEFIEKFKKPIYARVINGMYERSKGIISRNYLGVPWWFRIKLAQPFEGLDFGCTFDNGRCIRERKEDLTDYWQDKHNPYVSFCCSTCYLTMGNLHILPDRPILLKTIAGSFDETAQGWWREDTGCILPYGYRSTLCLTGRCSYLQQNIKSNKEVLEKSYRLNNIVSEWRRYQKRK